MEGTLIKRISFPCTEEYLRKLKQMKKQGNYRSMAALIRDILDERKITLDTYDTTWDKVLEQLSGIRTELCGIDLTMNLLLIDFQKMDVLKQQQLKLSLILKQHKAVSEKMEELSEITTKIAERCLRR